MSNPQINRWGANALWYNFWYADKNYGHKIQQDRIFTQLLETYLVYGTETPHNHYTNLYWYKTCKKSLPVMTYYRYVTIRRPVIKMITTMRLRNALQDYYRMRVWILRYGKWLIINLYWFNVNKKRMKRRVYQSPSDNNFVSVDRTHQTSTVRRLKAIYALTNINTLNTVQGANAFYRF